MKRLLFVILTLAFGLAIKAQSSAKEINAIKRDTMFLAAEDTKAQREEAINNAKTKLEILVSEWIRSTFHDEQIEACVAKTKEHCSLIEAKRGNLIRAFVYVKKSDLIPISANKGDMIIKVSPQQEVQNAESAQTQMASKEIESELSSGSNDKPIIQGRTLSVEEIRMKQISSFFSIENFVKSLQATNHLIAYGKFATMPAKGQCHALVYNQAGDVVAALRRIGDGDWLNLNTLQDDKIDNYKNCGAIWLQLK